MQNRIKEPGLVGPQGPKGAPGTQGERGTLGEPPFMSAAQPQAGPTYAAGASSPNASRTACWRHGRGEPSGSIISSTTSGLLLVAAQPQVSPGN